jgi:hypothetical protein
MKRCRYVGSATLQQAGGSRRAQERSRAASRFFCGVRRGCCHARRLPSSARACRWLMRKLRGMKTMRDPLLHVLTRAARAGAGMG